MDILVWPLDLPLSRELSVKVVSKQGDFLWFLKENQPGTWAEVRDLFEAPEPLAKGHSPSPNDFVTARTVEKNHGRIEERRITVSSEMKGYVPWPYLEQVFKLERHTTVRGVTKREVRYGLTSLPKEIASAARLLAIARAEWGIENSLHYRRDVTLGEDASQLRRGDAPQANAILNNIVLGLGGLGKVENVAAARRDLEYTYQSAIISISVLSFVKQSFLQWPCL